MGRARSFHGADLAGSPNLVPRSGAVGPHPEGRWGTAQPQSSCIEEGSVV